MKQGTINLFHIPITDLIHQIDNEFECVYDYQKHVIFLKNQSGDTIGQIRLPLHLTLNDQLEILNENTQTLYLSIESGNAAICTMKGKTNTYHTTFSAYMTRKKQGVSQIKYLNKKGKSRAGSRVRLAKTIEFFENINSTLGDLLKEETYSRIGINCNATLIPFLYNSKVQCPWDKKDQRLYKIPLHIPQSNFTHLDKAIKKLMAPLLIYDNRFKDELKIFDSLNNC
ncbi:hypothetical protein [Reichenbachiella sp.]|uniref:hypothetical protein n=1 Tax=Reichenbachiella sp. TaxID=2184521 RepID=UPI003BB016DF